MPNVQFYTTVSTISDFIISADVAFISGGRIMYQVCSLGIPSIIICRDDQETKNVFGSSENGFVNMGMGAYLSQEDIIKQFNEVVDDFELRNVMNKRMLEIDLKHGFEKIGDIVKSNYREFKLKN